MSDKLKYFMAVLCLRFFGVQVYAQVSNPSKSRIKL